MRRILIIIPFEEIYPPMNGGKLRAMNLLHQLARHFEVTAIIQQDLASFSRSGEEYPAIKNCTILSTAGTDRARDLFSILPSRIARALRFRYWNRSFKGSAEESFLLIYPVLRQLLKKKKFDYAVLEEMGSLNTSRTIRRYLPDARIIYDAYNVNTKLAATEMENGIMPASNFELIQQLESNLHKSVDGIFTCSIQDLTELIRMNDNKIKGVVIPNGVNVPAMFPGYHDVARASPDDILFCGSLDYFPNREGLAWFCQEVFPLLLALKPSARLLVVGRGEPGEKLEALLRHKSIIFFGKVDKVGDYYRKATLAIVPLLSGSGTRLKLLEAMGFGVAVVSTTTGAEGIAYTDHKNIIIADEPASFAGAVARLLNDRATTRRIAEEAYTFVKNEYDWEVAGRKLEAYFNG